METEITDWDAFTSIVRRCTLEMKNYIENPFPFIYTLHSNAERRSGGDAMTTTLQPIGLYIAIYLLLYLPQIPVINAISSWNWIHKWNLQRVILLRICILAPTSIGMQASQQASKETHHHRSYLKVSLRAWEMLCIKRWLLWDAAAFLLCICTLRCYYYVA